ncbi:endoplasmic reticulum-based factor for assembly of V-ATPase-domain-containing protein [Ampelomyces quisqualis]|uniref:Endoplasmic reticulum-based factor for assembly of V-ATPase-domain-containing protein n=1 Tax=Ampelomyces quisqualis TaxID=50730 RepID=A0A6A5QLX6_AMPQU|nr:endoplasmic reticulum-based factor for assembly of V-ATPase-domain-containing protein [Ampelomyces quisqualis]
MTPAIVQALETADQLCPSDYANLQRPTEPALANAQPGNPVSHTQLINLSKLLKKHAPTTLSSLLAHTSLYTPPAPPRAPKSPEYTALMARLRADQEALSYARMLHPPPPRESFSARFPSAANFSVGASAAPDSLDDDLSYEDVHRQIILIINILVSIVCVAVFVWVAARHWSVGKRLGLSMAGSVGIAVAEVVVYAGYVRKVQDAKRVERRKPEIKEIVRSWVIDKGDEKEEVVVVAKGEADGVRFRRGKHR